MKMDVEKAKQAIWARARKQVGWREPEDFHQYVDRSAGEIYDAEDTQHYEGTVLQFMEAGKLAAEHQYFPASKAPKRPREKRYNKPFERRLHIVDFIIGQQLTLRQRKKRSFHRHKQIKWKRILIAWNEAHPYDIMTLGRLQVAYRQAITQPDIQQAYFDRKDREVAAMYAKLLLELKPRIEEWQRRHPEERGK